MRKFGFLFFFSNAFAQLNTQLMGLERGVYWSAFFFYRVCEFGFGKVSEYRFRNKLFIIISFFSLNSMRSLNEVKKNVE